MQKKVQAQHGLLASSLTGWLEVWGQIDLHSTPARLDRVGVLFRLCNTGEV